MVALSVETLGVTLGGRRAVEGVSANFAPGGLVGIIGPNGAGKSTLVRAMLGLVEPSAGDVRLDGAPIAGLRRAEIARLLAYLPQGQVLHWPLAVERVVALGRLPLLTPMSRLAAADLEAVDRAMARADVTHLRGRVATELSGGERARVLLARALAQESSALIVDEPLAALDPGHQIEIMDLLRAQAAAGQLVIAVLHDLSLAARYCDRLLLLDGGRLVADGTPDAVLTPERLAQTFGVRAWFGSDGGVPLIVPTARIGG
ncbi:ABC transporter ATP-binding protein [Sphingoaurantiacus capsulatus]|uniref:ABC transporter ATP-binding protein n=1 Tax=Sphingoaurantiacus capsulatus TaxID=1771310 RepID=A0ABV7XCC7_9SPHN